jgi:hypothetical protein
MSPGGAPLAIPTCPAMLTCHHHAGTVCLAMPCSCHSASALNASGRAGVVRQKRSTHTPHPSRASYAVWVAGPTTLQWLVGATHHHGGGAAQH